MAQINFGMLDTSLPAQLGAMPGNALAAMRQRRIQDEQMAGQREQQQMQNALARMQLTKGQREMYADEALRTAAAGGGEWSEVVERVRKVDPMRALDIEGKVGAVQSSKAAARGAVTKQAWDKLEQYRKIGLENVRTPRDYAAWLHQQHTDPDLAPVMGMLPPLEESLRTIPLDPQQFEQFRQQGMLGMQKWLEMNKPSDFERTMDIAGLTPEERQATARQKLTKETTHAPKTLVSVNTGQKDFENELKIRSDFRSEPVYKAHQEMSSAYSQIQQALKQESPAGDLAGATKIMKLLDPGSVVRESELGMAMAASGLLDRVSNYATNIINGTKLTPTQRADFQRLADVLYSESIKAYNAKRNEYFSIATDYGMNPERIIGAPASAPTSGKSGKPQYVETRRTPDGRVLGKLADGTVEVIQ